jgi:mRNA interferase RelE/StbE
MAQRASLASLDKKIAQKVLNKLKWLVKNADDISHLLLEGNLSGLQKSKVGSWRVIYEADYDEKIIVVHKIGHRKDIYR